MTHLDLTYSDLPDDEIKQVMERKKQDAATEKAKDAERLRKAANFRFVGGM